MIPTYYDDIVMGIKEQNKFTWYVSNREDWILDAKKRIQIDRWLIKQTNFLHLFQFLCLDMLNNL
ncbi:hypothetical protein RyT2_29480 [Pseudolactococcus yaeyamensis]